MLTLDALIVIDAIERKGSFAAAAIELDRVPSALSYTIQKLEQELGVSLFRKEGRRSVLTPAGKVLAEGGSKLLADSQHLSDRVKQTATGWEPSLAIALETTVDREPVWTAIEKLYEVHPGLQLNLTEQVLGGAWEALFEDRVQLVIGAVENLPDQYQSARQGIRTLPWQPVHMVLVAAPFHPICHETQPLDLDTIQSHRGIVIADTSSRFGQLSRGQFREGNTLYVDNMQEKLSAHLKGLGVGLLPQFLIEPYLASGDLVALHTAVQPVPEPTSLAWRVSNQGKALTFLIDQLQATLSN